MGSSCSTQKHQLGLGQWERQYRRSAQTKFLPAWNQNAVWTILKVPSQQRSHMLLLIFMHFSTLGQTLVCGETNIGLFQPCALWNPVRPPSKGAGQWPSSPLHGAGHCRFCFKAKEPFWQSYYFQKRILSQAGQFFHETVVGWIGKYQHRAQYCKVWGHAQEFLNYTLKQTKKKRNKYTPIQK